MKLDTGALIYAAVSQARAEVCNELGGIQGTKSDVLKKLMKKYDCSERTAWRWIAVYVKRGGGQGLNEWGKSRPFKVITIKESYLR